MPAGDITHPVTDLTGSIAEGQIVLSTHVHARGMYAPLDPLASLSKLMRRGAGPGRTREDHLDLRPLGSTGNAAIESAAACFRAALQAGVRTAAAGEAVRRIDAEIALTRRRLRSLEKRWLRWLQDTPAHLELSLEQGELEDAIHLRRAGNPSPDRRSRP